MTRYAPRYAVEIKWISRSKHYVARVKRYSALVAYGATREEAQTKIEARLHEHLKGNNADAHHRELPPSNAG